MEEEGIHDVWRTICLQSTGRQLLMMKSKFDLVTCSYDLAVFDGIHMWNEAVAKSEFSERCKEMNPKVEADFSYVFNEIKIRCCNLEQEKNMKIEKEEDFKRWIIYLKFKLEAGIPYSWRFILQRVDDSVAISQNVILPMFSMLGELSQRQTELFRIINRKDSEIQDFKDQGVASSRKNLETACFEHSHFLKHRLQSQEFLNHVNNPMTTFADADCQMLFGHVVAKQGRTERAEQNCAESIQKHEKQVQMTATATVQDRTETCSNEIFLDTNEELARRVVIEKKLKEKAGETKRKAKRKKINL